MNGDSSSVIDCSHVRLRIALAGHFRHRHGHFKFRNVARHERNVGRPGILFLLRGGHRHDILSFSGKYTLQRQMRGRHYLH